MQKFNIFVLSFLMFILLGHLPSKAESLNKWEYKIAKAIKKFMKRHNEVYLTLCAPNEAHTKQFITDDFLKQQVAYDYDAARLNPSWGPRKLVCIKEIVYQYNESRYNKYEFNINTNGTVDFGIGQINSCHITMFRGEKTCGFINFCKMLSIPPNLKLLWNPYYNSLLSAYLNEDFIKTHQETYHYYTTPLRKELYDMLIKVGGLEKDAIKYNDGEYTGGESFKPENFIPFETPALLKRLVR